MQEKVENAREGGENLMVTTKTTLGQGRILFSRLGENQACPWTEAKEPSERLEIRIEQ